MSQPKIMLITGGSRGIGAAIAVAAVERGYDLCINYHNDQQAANNVVEMALQAGRRAIAVKADVSDSNAVDSMFERCDKELGAIDVLMNNAGIVAEASRFDALTPSRVQRILDINISGAIYCASAAVKRMSTRHQGKGGNIVNISSIAALMGGPNEYVDYAMSKGAMDSMTIGLAKEVADEGVRVNAIRPGLIYTDIHASGGEPGRVDRLVDVVPMKRGGQASEVALAALWLASDEASYVTGSFLNVSGGR